MAKAKVQYRVPKSGEYRSGSDLYKEGEIVATEQSDALDRLADLGHLVRQDESVKEEVKETVKDPSKEAGKTQSTTTK